MGVNFFLGKKTIRGGGGPRGFGKRPYFSPFFCCCTPSLSLTIGVQLWCVFEGPNEALLKANNESENCKKNQYQESGLKPNSNPKHLLFKIRHRRKVSVFFFKYCWCISGKIITIKAKAFWLRTSGCGEYESQDGHWAGKETGSRSTLLLVRFPNCHECHFQ